MAVQPLGENKEGELWLVSKTDGQKTATLPVGERPCFDGVAVAEGRIYLSTEEGSIIAFGK
jgi:hypothetical protein